MKNSIHLKGLVQKLLCITLMGAIFLAAAARAQANTRLVDIAGIARGMCTEMLEPVGIPFQNSPSDTCKSGLKTCESQLGSLLQRSIIGINQWAGQGEVFTPSGENFTTNLDYYNKYITVQFIQEHRYSEPGWDCGHEALLEMPYDYDQIKSNLENLCKQNPSVMSEGDPTPTPSIHSSSNSDNANVTVSPPADAASNNAFAPQSPPSAANAPSGGGCSMVSGNSTGNAWNLLSILAPLVPAFLKRKKK